MGSSAGNAKAANAGAVGSGEASTANASKFGGQNSALFSTLFGSPNSSGTGTSGGTLSGMMNPNSLNISSPTGPYALQYQQAKANNALGTQQNAQAINRAAGNSGFGAGAPAGYTGYLQSQNTQAGNTNAGNLFSQYAGQSYQDALNNFWKANQAAGTAMGEAGNQQNTAQGQAGQTYTQLYGASPKTTPGQQFLNSAAGGAGSAAGSTVGGKA